MTHVGPTVGSTLYFMDTEESLAALCAAGFQAEVYPLPSWRPYTDALFLARKPKPALAPLSRGVSGPDATGATGARHG